MSMKILSLPFSYDTKRPPTELIRASLIAFYILARMLPTYVLANTDWVSIGKIETNTVEWHIVFPTK